MKNTAEARTQKPHKALTLNFEEQATPMASAMVQCQLAKSQVRTNAVLPLWLAYRRYCSFLGWG
ncbi:MAG: hypothetical protein WCO72_14895, partial [Betaproteobacteria bacterium]